MVEYKTSVYDEQVPPLVPAAYAPNEGEDNDDVPSALQEDETRPPTDSTDDNTASIDEEEKNMVASGTAGAVIGFFMGGPLIAALLGFGAAYCTKKEGTTGDAARALGEVAVSTQQKAKELDEKHKIVDRSKKVANDAWEKAKAYDQQYNALDKVMEAVVYSWGAFVNFVQERRLLERGVDGVGRGYEYVAERMSSSSDGNTAPHQQSQTS